jgi:DNA-binding MarR family transcriptional regulator
MICTGDYLVSHAAGYYAVVRDDAVSAAQNEKVASQQALVDDLGWGLGVVFRAYVTAAHAAVADLPGGPRGYQVLSSAARGAVRSQVALAQNLGIDRTVMTYLLDDLEAAGLLARRPDPADRRARQIVATDKGTELLIVLDRRLQDAEAHLLGSLDEDARQSFRAQVRLIATQANALDPVVNPCELADNVDATLAAPGSARRR